MSSMSKNSKISLKRTPRRRATTSSSSRRRQHVRTCGAKTKKNGKGGNTSSSRVSDKLETLRNLISAQNGDIVKADQLFQETADYIVLLRTQVFVLQRLIEFYGPSSNGTENMSTDAVL
uniref:Uncharacterized protein MANES_02G054200 n=1 Tax=Rhizophora mucronata TaxID=61149 RepID=A0A2P2MXJ4_RHIMU